MASRFSLLPLALPRLSALLAASITVLCCLVALPATAGAAWPGRNGAVFFVGGEKSPEGSPLQPRGIYRFVPGKAGSLHRLTSDPSDADPQVSPDGRWVAFSRTTRVVMPLHAQVSAIYLMRPDGSHLHRLTDGGAGLGGDSEPAFAPSGKRLLFVRSGPGESIAESGDIYSIRLDGSGLHQLTSGPDRDRAPVFSPNGRLIAFQRAVAGESTPERFSFDEQHIYTARPDGSHLHDATPMLTLEQRAADPDFSPSGRRLAFAAAGALYEVRPSGADLRRLTPTRPGAQSWAYSEPAFAPDGRSLLLTAETPYQSRIARLGLGPSGRLGRLAVSGASPVWQP